MGCGASAPIAVAPSHKRCHNASDQKDAHVQKDLIRKLHDLSPTELNAFFQKCDLDGLTDLFGTKKKTNGAFDQRFSLHQLIAIRIDELCIKTKLVIIQRLCQEELDGTAEESIAAILLRTSGHDLTALKQDLEFGSNPLSLPQLLLSSIKTSSLRETILDHLSREGEGVRLAVASGTKRKLLKVVSDIDDTFMCRLKDCRFPKGAVYPGVLEFYEALQGPHMNHVPNVLKKLRRSQRRRSTHEPSSHQSESSSAVRTPTNRSAANAERSHVTHSESKRQESRDPPGVLPGIPLPVSWSGSRVVSRDSSREVGGDDLGTATAERLAQLVSGASSPRRVVSEPSSGRSRDERHVSLPPIGPDVHIMNGHVMETDDGPRRASMASRPRDNSRQTVSITSVTGAKYLPSDPGSHSGSGSDSDAESDPGRDGGRGSDEAATASRRRWMSNVVFITARPRLLRDVLHNYTRREVSQKGTCGVDNVTVVSGSVGSLWGSRLRDKKYDNFCTVRRMYPEFDFIFLGDSGQHDIAVAQLIVQNFPGTLAGVLIHDVVNTPPEHRASLKEQGVLLFDTYIGAAVEALRNGLFNRLCSCPVANPSAPTSRKTSLAVPSRHSSLAGPLTHTHTPTRSTSTSIRSVTSPIVSPSSHGSGTAVSRRSSKRHSSLIVAVPETGSKTRAVVEILPEALEYLNNPDMQSRDQSREGSRRGSDRSAAPPPHRGAGQQRDVTLRLRRRDHRSDCRVLNCLHHVCKGAVATFASLAFPTPTSRSAARQLILRDLEEAHTLLPNPLHLSLPP